ncbi:MAG: hypothetical protein KatS3mg051_1048 [Anaerolineae bacterium]|nr:MAG: hypothetical protein KatS3mg051_1048 [Anaerolineae bacterium]
MSADTPGAIARRCHELVWQTRHELEEFWPTPSWQHALLFAFTEAGEAVDAYLRQFGHYARNNERDMSVAAELADCAMMLLSAIQRPWNEQMTRAVDDQVWAYGERTDMERAMREVAYQVGGTLATGSYAWHSSWRWLPCWPCLAWIWRLSWSGAWSASGRGTWRIRRDNAWAQRGWERLPGLLTCARLGGRAGLLTS